ncbi:hypothetical protein EHYA_05613 [Embleya hyalina]|uniref:Uncharacterized protein n=1 Tax=Embleya hyalina TaxID=516124 RepID=A0A401YTJ3_9ACTN|nr:hypothetical protein EHYA_05613 [Embleya hyalina]
MQRGVQQRGMNTELGAFHVGFPKCVRQPHLGEQFAGRAAPGLTQSPKGRPVAVAQPGQHGIGVGEIEHIGTGWRPLGEPATVDLPRRVTEHPARVPNPRLPLRIGSAATRAPGVDGDHPPARLVRRGDGNPQVHIAGLRQRQRGLQGQFLDLRHPGRFPGPQGEFEERGPRQHHRVHDRVVRQPGQIPQRDPTGRDHRAVGLDTERAEQRVGDRCQAEIGRTVGSRLTRGQPIAAVSERVGGQGDRPHPGTGRVEQRLGVGPGAVRDGLRHRDEEAAPVAVVAAQRADRGAAAARVQRFLGAEREHGVRADLHEQPVTVLAQRPNGRLVPHRSAQIAIPVVGVEAARVGQASAGHGGIEGRGRGSRPHLGQVGQEPITDPLHVRGVRRVVDRDPPGPQVVRRATAQERVQCLGVAADHGGGGPVDGGHAEPAGPGFEQRGDPVGGQRHRGHPAAAGGRDQRPAAQRDHLGGVRQGQGARDVRGGDLALRVADHGLRFDADRTPQRGQRDHHREQRRLYDVDARQRRGPGFAEHVERRPVDVRVQRVGAGPHGGGERLAGVQEFQRHPGPLGALSGKDEHGCAPGRRAAADQPVGGSTGGERGQPVQRLGVGACGHHGGVLEPGPTPEQRIPDIGQGRSVRPPQQHREPFPLRPQRGLAPRGNHQRHGVGDTVGPGLAGKPRCLLAGIRLLHDHMRVRPADPERRHRRPARSVVRRPVRGRRRQRDRPVRPPHVRRRFAQVQRPGHRAVPQGQHGLDQSGHTRRGLGVADVGFHRAEQQRPIGGPLPAVRGKQRLRLDRVAQRCPGAVRLDQVDVVRTESGGGQRVPDHPLLGGPVGRAEPVAGPVLVDRRAAEHGEYGMAVAARVGQAFQQEHAHALGPGGAVGVRRERLATTVGGQAALPGELDEHAGAGHHGGAARQGQRTLPAHQRTGGQVHRDQRGRAGGVDGQRRARQAERVGDPPGGDTRRGAGQQESGVGVAGFVHARAVLLRGGADEHPHPLAAQRGRVESRAFDRLPGGLQEQPLLRVHGQRLTRADPEELRVEVARAVQESAGPYIAGARPVRVVVVEPIQVPAAVGGEGGDRVHAVRDQVPQVLGGAHRAGQPAAHRHDGDRFVGTGRPGRRPGAGRRGRVERPGAQVVGERGGCGVVEDRGRGQVEAGVPGQPGDQFDGGERVQARFAVGAVGFDGRARAGAQDRGRVCADQVEQDPMLFGRGQSGQSLDRRRCPGGRFVRRGGVGGLRRGARPVACASEGVRGQCDPACPTPLEHPLPVRVHAVRVQAGHRRGQRVRLGAVAAQCRNRGHGVPLAVDQAGPGRRRQAAVRAEFEQYRRALRPQPAHPVVEAHGVPHVADPVVRGAGLFGGQRQAGQVRYDGQGGRLSGQFGRHLGEGVRHGVHAR